MTALGRERRVRSGRERRRLATAFGCLALALGLLLTPPRAPGTLAASADGLVTRADATYTVRPADHLVQVAVDVAATNTQPDRSTSGGVIHYFFTQASFGVQPEATRVHASSGSRALAVTVRSQTGFRRVDVAFGRSLFYSQTLRFRLEYDLPGLVARSRGNVRVLSAFVSFYAWSFGDVGSVRIVFPAGFVPNASGSPMVESTDGAGRVILQAAGITDGLAWFENVTADLESALTKTRIVLPDAELVVHAWPEDLAWQREVVDLLSRGIPELQVLIGRPWPVVGALDVREIHTPLLEGYAGFFESDVRLIEISEDLDPVTIVHEASHAWFNADLFTGRWINEGLANEYASLVLAKLGAGYVPLEVARRSNPVAFPLQSWPPPGRIIDKLTDARERYGYAASYTVVKALVDEVGVAGMRSVFAAAGAGTIPYRGAPAPEKVTGTADWRRLLDLLEQVAGSHQASSLFRTWVVPVADMATFDRRDAAVKDYRALVTEGGGWQPPFMIRSPMATWAFDAAEAGMTEARKVLVSRDQIVVAAAALQLQVPSDLKTAYESALNTMSAPLALADGELAALSTLSDTTAALNADRDVLTTIGLLGSQPNAQLDAARSAFNAGNIDEAVTDAAKARAIVDRARGIGRERVVVGAGIGSWVVVVSGGALFLVRRRRRRRAVVEPVGVAQTEPLGWPEPAGPPVSPDDPLRPVAERPYATLPPDPAPETDRGPEKRDRELGASEQGEGTGP